MAFGDPHFWRAGAISSIVVMVAVLVMLTTDTLWAMRVGGAHVPAYTVINRDIDVEPNPDTGISQPIVEEREEFFGRNYTQQQAADLIRHGKLAIQSHACMDCHTFFGNGAYYAPDLTRAWLDPAWKNVWMPMTQAKTREEAMARFLMAPQKYATWSRKMPDLHIARDEAVAIVAYLKWLSAVDTNGFPNGFSTK
ncbi:MAG TPA: c-type cytochrome [Candidatus Baltobacteraceae bacterium]|nr:c-type cytochrome [Candidatus Baltobacteraceae bacterium]